MKIAIGNVGDMLCVTKDVDSNNGNAGSCICLNAKLDEIDHELYRWEDANSNIKRVPDINTSVFIYDDTCDECIASSVDEQWIVFLVYSALFYNYASDAHDNNIFYIFRI